MINTPKPLVMNPMIPNLLLVTPRQRKNFDEDEAAAAGIGNKTSPELTARADKFEKLASVKTTSTPSVNLIVPPPPKESFWESKLGTVAKWGIGGAAVGGISTFIEPIAEGVLNIFGKGVKELGWAPRAGIVIGVGAAIGALVGIIPALLQKSKTEQELSGGYLVETAIDADGTPQTKVLSSPSTTYISTGGDGGYSSRYRDDAYGYSGGGGYYGGNGYGGGGRFLEDYLVASAIGNAINGGGRDYHHYHYGSPYGSYGYGRRGTTINNHHYYGGGDDYTHPTTTYTPSSPKPNATGGSGGVFKNADGSSRSMWSNSKKSSGKSTPTMRTSGFSSNKYGASNRSFLGGSGSKSSGRGFGSSSLKSSGGGWHGGGSHPFGSGGRSSGGGSKK